MEPNSYSNPPKIEKPDRCDPCEDDLDEGRELLSLFVSSILSFEIKFKQSNYNNYIEV